MAKYSISKTGIDSFLWDVKQSAYIKLGDTRRAENAVSALVWYVNTGRASSEFLNCLFTFSPSVVANSLIKGGSDLEKIARLKKSVNRKAKKGSVSNV